MAKVMSAAARKAASDRMKALNEAKKAGGEIGGAPAVHPRAAAAKTERRRRKGMGNKARLKLSIPPHLENDPNYRYYWVADRPGRVEQLTKYDDYEFVTDEETAADGRNTGTGTRIERHADVDKFGNPIRHFLLRKPMDYHIEDKREKAEQIQKTMTAIKRGSTPNDKGEVIHDDRAYVPERGITISHGDYQP